MYTQCPDCSTAFRVTAEVLKQAAGKVRCGGCGIAFNALEFLSEQMPAEPASNEDGANVPELRPEPPSAGKRTPTAISAEQSAALLKTLDELAGSDIRIEDTGVEWRVLDDDAASDDIGNGEAAMTHGVDELLDESPTPIDQFLTKTPNDIDAGEIFEESANATAQTPVDELRFDDNTPLPDDFGLDEESSNGAAAQAAEPHAESKVEYPELSAHPRDADEAAVDIATGEPEEWADILGEFSEPYVPPLDAELSALEEILPEDGGGETPAGSGEGDTPPDMDTQFALQAEAMGIDLSGLHTTAAESTGEHAAEDDIEELDVAAAQEKDEEIDAEPVSGAAMDDTELQLADDNNEAPGEMEPETTLEAGEDAELELLDETGTAVQLEGESDSQAQSFVETDSEGPTLQHSWDDSDEDEVSQADEAPLEFGNIEKAMEELEEQSDVFDQRFFEDGDAEDAELAGEPDSDDIVLEGEPDSDDIALEGEPDGDDIVLEDEPDQAPDDADKLLEDSREADVVAIQDAFDVSEPGSDGETLHVLPPQSEEEQTLNRLIDQELLSMAVEDEDGFASTIVFSENGAKEAIATSAQSEAGEDATAGFESIVMEGEFIRSALDQEKHKADIAAAALLAEEAKRARKAEADDTDSNKRPGMIAAAVLLALLLVVQVLHQSREALATIPVFNDTVGPLYRAIGMPLSPAWDVTGWRFEAKREVPDDVDGTLTVISRIGNTSEKPLPYPLINISLTDRFEEAIGTKTLDPADYLTNDLDPRRMVQAGKNFTAVMKIASLPENATGYKLQVCYRQPDAKLRCHIPNFK